MAERTALIDNFEKRNYRYSVLWLVISLTLFAIAFGMTLNVTAIGSDAAAYRLSIFTDAPSFEPSGKHLTPDSWGVSLEHRRFNRVARSRLGDAATLSVVLDLTGNQRSVVIHSSSEAMQYLMISDLQSDRACTMDGFPVQGKRDTAGIYEIDFDEWAGGVEARDPMHAKAGFEITCAVKDNVSAPSFTERRVKIEQAVYSDAFTVYTSRVTPIVRDESEADLPGSLPYARPYTVGIVENAISGEHVDVDDVQHDQRIWYMEGSRGSADFEWTSTRQESLRDVQLVAIGALIAIAAATSIEAVRPFIDRT